MAQIYKRYFQALGATAIAMVAYCLTIVSWIEPGNRAGYTLPEFTGMASSDRWWEPIFQASDWQNQQPTVVQNSRGVLLARSWQQVDQQTWRLEPLTIVLSQVDKETLVADNDPTELDVWVITANQGATIHFDQPLDLNSGRVPSIQRGHLEGDIHISRISLDSPTSPNLQLRTKNLTIDRRQIWTHDEVVVDSNNLLIRGRMLRFHLFGDILSKQSVVSDDDAPSRIGPIEEIELVHLDAMKMRLRPGGIWGGLNPSLLHTSVPIAGLPAEIEAQCGGRFSLNLNKEQAILSGGVFLSHRLQGLPPDEFQCHRIQVQFETEASSSHPTPAGVGSNHREMFSNLQLREIEAFGFDSLENLMGETWVELNAPTLDASVRAKRLRYDFRKQRVELAGKLNQPGATVSVAELNYRGHHFRAPSIEYQAAPKEKTGKPRHAGWMVAQGEGEVSTPADSPMGEVQIRWQERFQFAPSDTPGEQWVEIAGRTLIESKNRGFLTTDRLQLWLTNAGTSNSPDTLSPSHSAIETNSESTANPFQLQRLVAMGPTQIAAGSSKLDVTSLDLKFTYPTKTQSLTLAEPADSKLMLNDSSGSSMFQVLTQPGMSERFGSMGIGGADSTSFDAPSPGSQSMQIGGKALTATIARAGEQMWVDGLTLHGPMSLKAFGGPMPVEVHGDSLVLATTSHGDMDLEIEGTPAQVNVADGTIQGPRIRYNQRDNQLWMDQPGECVLPASSLQALERAESLRWEMPLRCQWQGRMLFDGRVVHFDGGIRLSGAITQADRVWLVEGLCQSMDVQLAKPIHFNEQGRSNLNASMPHAVMQPLAKSPNELAVDDNARVEQIVLRQDVDFRVAQRDASGQRVSLQRLQVPALTIYVPEDKVVAHGPGEGLAKFQSGPSIGSLASSTGKSNNPQLVCANLRFRDSLVAILDRNEIVVDGNVNVVSTPIANWDETPDIFAITKLLPGQMSISSDQIKLYDTSTLNATQPIRMLGNDSMESRLWEVQATGNVLFEGTTDSGEFAGNGYQVTYVQSKNLLTLRGDGRTKAELRRTPLAGMVNAHHLTTVQGKSSANPSANFPTVVRVPVATLNVKTMAVDVPEGGLDVQVDFQGQSSTINPSGALTPNRPGEPGQTTPMQPPNPRDGIKNFLRGY